MRNYLTSASIDGELRVQKDYGLCKTCNSTGASVDSRCKWVYGLYTQQPSPRLRYSK
mgnify:CR=1 FL=1